MASERLGKVRPASETASAHVTWPYTSALRGLPNMKMAGVDRNAVSQHERNAGVVWRFLGIFLTSERPSKMGQMADGGTEIPDEVVPDLGLTG